MLVEWPEECATSIVRRQCLVEPSVPCVGCTCTVKAGKKLFTGCILGIGKLALSYITV